ncbi:MAG: flagellar export chaperone FlgN [Candidatus Marinimicrobia bacterium]|nr:flagellar export chaperone FlgN [Candidatus Neomarinimicrobiota bacterium]
MMTNTKTFYKQLDALLSVEKKKYLELKTILVEKQNAIVQNNLKELQDSIISEQDMLQEIAELATKRDAVSHELAAFLGIRDRRITLTKIMARSSEENKERLEKRKSDLKSILKGIDIINKENSKLLEFSIHNIHELVSKIMGFNKISPSMYNLSGKKDDSHNQANIFNIKI